MAVIKIPNNATNGDVIKALFNPYKICVYEYSVHVYITKENFDTCDDYVVYAREWWDAPFDYQLCIKEDNMQTDNER